MKYIETVSNLFKGSRPDVTPIQLVSLIGALAVLLRVFGVYDLSSDQQEALIGVGVILLGSLGADAKIRGDRNKADAIVKASGNAPTEDLPDDDEEFEDPAPDVESDAEKPGREESTTENPVQPSECRSDTTKEI